eukprot:SAG11_NODE_1532_length_4732_cov_4.721563_8_plen_129_part_00
MRTVSRLERVLCAATGGLCADGLAFIRSRLRVPTPAGGGRSALRAPLANRDGAQKAKKGKKRPGQKKRSQKDEKGDKRTGSEAPDWHTGDAAEEARGRRPVLPSAGAVVQASAASTSAGGGGRWVHIT